MAYTPIDPADRARRLGNVARILIELARQHQAAESDLNSRGLSETNIAEPEKPR